MLNQQISNELTSLKININYLSKMFFQGENAGKRIQNYVFNYSDCIGKGNFSKVYKAHHQVTNEIVAIKIIELSSLKSQKLEELLFQEIDVLKKLNHPNVLRCFQVFTSNHRCYIITEFCNQGDLETKLRRVRTFTQREAESIIRDIFSGLLYLSEMKIVHRDIKVANIFMHNGRAKIADFGFAKFTTQKWQDVDIGSPIYMSPEGLINNIYGPKTDVWAFGVMLYEFFHGQSPYAKCHSQLQLKTMVSIPLGWNQIRSDLSQQMKQIIMRCLQVNQQKRITFQQLKYFPYMRNLLQGGYRIMPLFQSNPTERKSDLYKPNSHKQLRQTPNRRNLVRVNNNRMISPTNSRQTPYRTMSMQKDSKNNFFVHHDFSGIKRVISNPNNYSVHIHQVQRDESYTPGSPNISNRSSFVPLLISCAVTFKESVNLLHYCRLLYKFISINREIHLGCQQTTSIMHSFLMAILIQISERIQMKGIIYDGQNVWLREKKLREVLDEYTKKYTKQLGYISLFPGTGLGTIKDLAYDQFLQIDTKLGWESPEKHIVLGLIILVIWHSSRFIQQCYEQRSYKSFGNYKQIEDLLNRMKEKVDFTSYQNYKEKLCN